MHEMYMAFFNFNQYKQVLSYHYQSSVFETSRVADSHNVCAVGKRIVQVECVNVLAFYLEVHKHLTGQVEQFDDDGFVETQTCKIEYGDASIARVREQANG